MDFEEISRQIEIEKKKIAQKKVLLHAFRTSASVFTLLCFRATKLPKSDRASKSALRSITTT